MLGHLEKMQEAEQKQTVVYSARIGQAPSEGLFQKENFKITNDVMTCLRTATEWLLVERLQRP